MPKTKQELNKLKEEYDFLKSKLLDLSDDELKQVTGGDIINLLENIEWEIRSIRDHGYDVKVK